MKRKFLATALVMTVMTFGITNVFAATSKTDALVTDLRKLASSFNGNVTYEDDELKIDWKTSTSEESRYLSPNPPKPELPTGCEYKSRRAICVKKIENKDEYLDLLLDADPSKTSIYKYLNDSDVYGLQVEENIVSLAVILHIDKNTLELKNLVTKKEYRGNGYAKKLLKSLCGNYKQKYNKMLVGTTENNIPFYVKQGFDKYEKTIKNYFVDNYDEEIIDGDLHCIDMYYYSKDLKK